MNVFCRKAVAAVAMCGTTLLLGCGTLVPVEGEVPDASPAAIDIAGDGGIAALSSRTHVDSASGDFLFTVGPLCPAGAPCAVLRTNQGKLTRSQVDALFRRAASAEFRGLRADYGTTRNGADMIGYRLTIRASGVRREIAADDGTMPALMAQFLHDVSALVSMGQ